MAIVTNDAWRADGIDIMDRRHWIESVGGREAVNGKRQPTWSVPFRQGTPELWDAPYQAKTLTLGMAISGTDANGAVTYAGGQAAHLRDNLDRMLSLWSKRGTAIALARDVPTVPGPGVSTRTADVTVTRQFSIDGPNGQFLRRMIVQLYMPWPFWVGGPVTIPTMSPAEFFVDGTAPAYPKITFNEPGTLVLEGSPHFISSTEAGLVVDVRNKVVSKPAAFSAHLPDWFPLPPGEVKVDGPSVNIEYNPQWL